MYGATWLKFQNTSKLHFSPDTILRGDNLISDTFEIASRNRVLFSSNSRGSYVGGCVVKISKYLEFNSFYTNLSHF